MGDVGSGLTTLSCIRESLEELYGNAAFNSRRYSAGDFVDDDHMPFQALVALFVPLASLMPSPLGSAKLIIGHPGIACPRASGQHPVGSNDPLLNGRSCRWTPARQQQRALRPVGM